MSTELNKNVLVSSMSALNEDKVYLLSKINATVPSIVAGYETVVKDNGFEHDIGFKRDGNTDNGIDIFLQFGNIIGKRLYIIGPYKDSTKSVLSIDLAHHESGPPTAIATQPIVGMNDDPDNILTYMDILQDPNDADSVIILGPISEGSSVTANKSSPHKKSIPLDMVYQYVGRYESVNSYEIHQVGLRILNAVEADVNNSSASTDTFITYEPEVIDMTSIMVMLQSIDKTLTSAMAKLNSQGVSIATIENNISSIRTDVLELGGSETNNAIKLLSNNMRDVLDGLKVNQDALSLDRERSELHMVSTDKFNAECITMLKNIKIVDNDTPDDAKISSNKVSIFLQIGTFIAVLIGFLRGRNHK